MEINGMGAAAPAVQSDYGRNIDQKIVKTEGAKPHDMEKQAADNKAQRSVDSKELDRAVDIANKVLFKNNTHLQFKIHDKTKDVMVKIVNDETGEVVKEIPPEKMLDMVAKLWEIAGILVDERR